MKKANNKYTSNEIKVLDFNEHVRLRPFMYIGNEGVLGLLKGLIIDCIALCKTDKITFEFSILGINDFNIKLTSKIELTPFINQFTNDNEEFKNYFPKVLKAISDKLEIKQIGKLKLEIQFSIDKNVMTNTNVDYLKLSELSFQIALLNRNCEIITIDKRHKYLSQNYYHFSQGIFYVFDRFMDEALGKPEFKIRFDDKINSNNYQIGLSYRSDWFPLANLVSYANDQHTIYNGSLVDGIIEGLTLACKTYVKENNYSTFKITKKKLFNGLILVCSVRGENFNYGGSSKDSLEDENVKTESKKIIKKIVLDIFKSDKQIADSFLWRFDETKLGSQMY